MHNTGVKHALDRKKPDVIMNVRLTLRRRYLEKQSEAAKRGTRLDTGTAGTNGRDIQTGDPCGRIGKI